MICKNCGSEIRDGLKFCPKCGTQITEPAAEQPAQTDTPVQQSPVYSQPPKKNNNKLIIIIAAIVLSVLIAAGAALAIIFDPFGLRDDDSSGSKKKKSSSSSPSSQSETSSQKQEPSTEPATAPQAQRSPGSGFDANASADDLQGEEGASLVVWAPTELVSGVQAQCDRFASKFSDANISITVKAQSETDAATMLQTNPDAGADVFGFPSDQLSTLAERNLILSVPEEYAADIKATNTESSVGASSDSAGTLYAYPETGNGYFLVYDKRVVSAADAGKLESVLAACKKANKKFVMDAGNGYYSCMFIFTGGLETQGISGGTQQFNNYDADKVAASMKAFSKLMHDYKGVFVSDTVSKIQTGFASKGSRASSVGAGIDGAWNAASDKTALGSNYGAAKLPTININGQDTQIVSMYGYKMMGVNASTHFPKTASALAYYLTSEECQKERFATNGWAPTQKKLMSDSSVLADTSVAAMLAQSQFSVAQANLRPSFWDPLSVLGSELYADDTNPDSFDFKGLLEKTIKNINS